MGDTQSSQQQQQQYQYQQQQQAFRQAQNQAQANQVAYPQPTQQQQMAASQQFNQLMAQQRQQQQQQPQNAAQFNQMYRSWRQTIHQKQGSQTQQDDTDLKNFYIKVHMHKDSIKTNITSDHKLQLEFKVDTLTNAFIRVNTCVTERKNANNVPEMFFTPNQSHYVQEFRLNSGLGQTIQMGQIAFDLNYLAAYELTQSVNDYHPLIISINYNDNGRQYAMMSYGVFTRDGDQNITGARIEKQVVLINGMPFEIKSIYGLDQAADTHEGAAVVEDDGEKECLVCLCEQKDTLIMPCGHFCICNECGKGLIKAKQTCPICRGNIGSLIPIKQ